MKHDLKIIDDNKFLEWKQTNILGVGVKSSKKQLKSL
jgi:hypothetical protein